MQLILAEVDPEAATPAERLRALEKRAVGAESGDRRRVPATDCSSRGTSCRCFVFTVPVVNSGNVVRAVTTSISAFTTSPPAGTSLDAHLTQFASGRSGRRGVDVAAYQPVISGSVGLATKPTTLYYRYRNDAR